MPLERELRSRAEETPLWEDLEAQNERLRQLDSDFLEGVDREIRDRIDFYQRECRILSQEIEAAGTQAQLVRDNPTNLAINTLESSLSSEASERSRRFEQQCEVLFAEPSEAIEGMPRLRQQVVEAHDRLAPSGERGFNGTRLVLSLSLGLILVTGLSALLDSFSRTRLLSGEERPQASDDTTPELNRRAELTSLLLQAAANRPVDASRYGVTSERFHALRAAVLAMLQELPEQQYWEQLALAAEAGYGADGAAYTLGDHFYALELAFVLLEPLVDPQPCEVDLDRWLTVLRQQWQEGEAQAPGAGVPRLYRSLAELVPDDSGATRLIRLFVARAVLAQVALMQEPRAADSQPTQPARRLKGSMSNAFFQISGAAMFCLPPPFMAYGYLANTVMEVFFGGSDGSSAFFEGLASALSKMQEEIAVIKNVQMLQSINSVRSVVQEYSQALSRKYSDLPAEDVSRPDVMPSLQFFDDPSNRRQCVRGILEHFYGPGEDSLLKAVIDAQDMWANRQIYDKEGQWSLFLWLLLAMTTYLSCSRQLAAVYATIANLGGKTNYSELADKSWSAGDQEGGSARGAYRPDPTVLLRANGDAAQISNMAAYHWGIVRSHIKAVKTTYEWPSSVASKRSLYCARLEKQPGSGFGYYDQIWHEIIDAWRRAEGCLSRPAEIYRWFQRLVDDNSTEYGYYKSRGFAHGWLTSQRLSQNANSLEALDVDDLLPASGGENKPGTQQWLLAWYRDCCKLHPIAWLDETKDVIGPEDQCDFLDHFEAIFSIGSLHQPTWTYFLLQTVRKQLQSWRVQGGVIVDPQQGIASVDRLHGAAWPTTGELNRIVNCLDQALPCSWQAGPDYLNQVLRSLKGRWSDMAKSGADPSHLSWTKDEQGHPLTAWWRDRSNADQRPMPLLPETIALILEVWVAGAIRADRLQKRLREGDDIINDASELVDYLEKKGCQYSADDSKVAYQLPASIQYPYPWYSTNDAPNDKNVYDQERDQIRLAWLRKRGQALDHLLESYGLTPSSSGLSQTESMVQDWINGLLDETLNDDLKLDKPKAKITQHDPLPGLAKPSLGATLWQPGAKVQYSYQLRGVTSYRATGNDQLSEESDVPDPPLVELDDTTAAGGLAVRIPRDSLLLARQFLLYRTITPATGQSTKVWIGSGHFDPGQLDDAIFHDGNPPTPAALPKENVLADSTTKAPQEVSNWVVGNKVQYSLQYLDTAGRGNLSAASPLSEPVEIHNAACGFKLMIPSDPLGIATDVQVQRQILDPSGAVITKLTVIGKHPFPVDNQPGQKYVAIFDANVIQPPLKVSFILRMTVKGLELWRSDRSSPVWTSAGSVAPSQKLTSCRMQGDGNLVIYDKDLHPYWASGTMESPGKSDSQRALMLRANGELAIVGQIGSRQIIKPLNPADTTLPVDGPDVFLRGGEMMLLDQVLSTQNQSPQALTCLPPA